MEGIISINKRPPFNAKNIVELSKAIQKQEIDFSNSIQKVSPMTQKLIRSMLKQNPKDRISW
jgi:serine/threonine protein kinase